MTIYPKVILQRLDTGDEGTFGKVMLEDKNWFYSLELPERNNAVGKSCIPAGEYQCAWGDSPKHGPCYHVLGVVGRSYVEIHSANYAGDMDKGFKCELLGCISLGVARGKLGKQKAVIGSKAAVARFNELLAGKTFTLVVKEVVKDGNA